MARWPLAATSDAEAVAARQARDDALERVQRARRDASEVGARLRDEAAARQAAEQTAQTASGRVAVLETALHEAEAARDQHAAELEAVRRRAAERSEESDGAAAGAGDVLWALALARVERTWRTSISLGLEDQSPLVGATDPLRTAVEIEIDAAHEEAGADIELRWTGDGPVSSTAAVVALAAIESVVQSVAKTAATTTIDVTVGPEAVEVAFAATDDDGAPVELELPDALVTAPGRIRVDAPA